MEDSCGCRTQVLIENVVFGNRQEADHFSEEVNAKPVMVCSGDFHYIRRARLWWSRIDWESLPLKKSNLEGFTRIHTPEAWTDKKQHNCMKGLNLPTGATSRRHKADGMPNDPGNHRTR